MFKKNQKIILWIVILIIVSPFSIKASKYIDINPPIPPATANFEMSTTTPPVSVDFLNLVDPNSHSIPFIEQKNNFPNAYAKTDKPAENKYLVWAKKQWLRLHAKLLGIHSENIELIKFPFEQGMTNKEKEYFNEAIKDIFMSRKFCGKELLLVRLNTKLFKPIRIGYTGFEPPEGLAQLSDAEIKARTKMAEEVYSDGYFAYGDKVLNKEDHISLCLNFGWGLEPIASYFTHGGYHIVFQTMFEEDIRKRLEERGIRDTVLISGILAFMDEKLAYLVQADFNVGNKPPDPTITAIQNELGIKSPDLYPAITEKNLQRESTTYAGLTGLEEFILKKYFSVDTSEKLILRMEEIDELYKNIIYPVIGDFKSDTIKWLNPEIRSYLPKKR